MDDEKKLTKEIIEILRSLSKNPQYRDVIIKLLDGLLEEKKSDN